VRTYLKKIALVDRDYPNPVASTGFTVIRAAECILPQFLFLQVLSENFLQPIHALQTGSSYPAVRDKDVFAQPIRLAPTREQDRIVAKLDALLSGVKAGEAAARRALDRLQRYRAAILNAAVTGELTRDWRKNHEPDETGAQLLKRLLQERRARWEEAELKRLQAAGKPPKDEKWKKRYPEPIPPDTIDLPDLPEGWTWASVDQMAAHEPRAITDGPFGSHLKSSHYTDSGPRVIRLQNIGDGVFIDEKAHISRNHYDFLKEHAIYPGDLVIRALGIPAPRACKIPDNIGPAIVKADCIRYSAPEKLDRWFRW
jgi:type I restriction enzyme S subunit